jgi:uncharacterized membrane protein
MNIKKLWQWGVAGLMIILVPGIGCFEYYTGQALGGAVNGWRWLALLAYPLALVALVGLVWSGVQQPRSVRRIRLFGMLFLLLVILLLALRLA